jgi:hypothetical protein
MMANGQLTYGVIKHNTLIVHELDIKGRPTPTAARLAIDPDELRPVVRWRDGIAGEGESFFPQPQEWRLEGVDKPLDKVEVSDLTKAFTLKKFKPPTCIAQWESELGRINWRGLGERYTSGVQTPKDFGPHFKLALHRTMRTRDENWQRRGCCLCDDPRQTIAHWASCPALDYVFSNLRLLDGGNRWDDARLNLFGMGAQPSVAISREGEVIETPSMKMVDVGVSMVHFIVWKFIFIAITKLNLYGTPVSATEIQEQAQNRVKDRIKALTVRLRKKLVVAQAKNKPPNFDKERKWIRGLGDISDTGELTMNEAYDLWLI